MKQLFVFFIFFSTYCYSQTNFKHINTIKTEANNCSSDNQGNLYIIKGYEIIKYNKAGKLLYKYSNKNLGTIDFLDVSNQLKLLVFYKNFSQAIFLDNTLSMSGTPISFDQLGFQHIQLACTSFNNSILLYDQQTFSLVRLNSTYEETQRTSNMNTILNVDIQPNYLIEYDNKIYLNNPSTGILIFDIYGTYYKTIPVKNLTSFQPLGDLVYYKKDKGITSYNIKTTEESDYQLPITDFNSFSLQVGMIYLQKENEIYSYTNE